MTASAPATNRLRSCSGVTYLTPIARYDRYRCQKANLVETGTLTNNPEFGVLCQPAAQNRNAPRKRNGRRQYHGNCARDPPRDRRDSSNRRQEDRRVLVQRAAAHLGAG